jgi:hypothetical protein
MEKLGRLAILIVIFGALSFSQQFTMSGPDLIKSGPSGKPILVIDDGDKWSIPVLIYRDSDVETFIPDITTAGWVQWNVERFRRTGTFSTRFSSFYKNDHVCRRVFIPDGHKNDPKYLEFCRNLRYRSSFITIDTRQKTVACWRAVLIMKDGSQQLVYQRPRLSR